MSLIYLSSNLLAALLLPPFSLLLLGLFGLWLARRRGRLGRALVGVALAGLMLLATPVVSGFLLRTLMPLPPVLHGSEAEAVVILAGGRVFAAPEYGGDTLKAITLERLRYGAWLARRLHKPILLAGGDPEGRGGSEARLMQAALQQEYGLTAAWLEETSTTTLENARNSVAMLRASGIRRIYLVTHAWHLARSVPEFERLGMVVVPAGTGYHQGGIDPFSFVPSASGLQDSYFACHEWLGVVWYRWRHRFGD